MSGNLYAEKYEDGSFDICLDDSGRSLHLVVASRRPYPERRDELHRYADMFAAVPELLEALRDMLADACGNAKSCGHDFTCACAVDKACAAIAKATGVAQ